MDNGTNPQPPIDFPISPNDASTIEDTEGHGRRRGQAVTPGDEQTTQVLTDDDAEDTEGHRYARGFFYEDGEDTEGHGRRR